MRVLVLGGDGMLGHELLRQLRPAHELAVTLRQSPDAYAGMPELADAPCFHGVDVRRPDAVAEVLAAFQPEAVINAVGLVKQRPDGQSPLPALEVNAVFPHRLALLCRGAGARLVHLGTDCVFSGARGHYTEADEPDAHDVYGLTKLLGEVDDGAALTLRTSIIGLELKRGTSLVEWFLAQRGQVRGFTRAIYTGVTTMELSRLIDRLLTKEPDLTGRWHVASTPVSKHDLLRDLAELLQRDDVEVVADDSFACDRSLDASALYDAVGYVAPSWDRMLAELSLRIQQRTIARETSP